MKVVRTGNATLIISNEEMNDIMKMIKYHEQSGLLIKGVSKTVRNKAEIKQKNKRQDFSECY